MAADITERKHEIYVKEMLEHYTELEQKANKLIEKKKEALDWLDNRYVYLIIVLSALIGAAKDKLDSFYDDFEENLIDLHHNQRTKCIERRKKIESIKKSAFKKRTVIQNILKRGSPKNIRKVSEKFKSKVSENNDVLLTELEHEEFIDYQFDTKDALKKICLAMVTSTDVKLVSLPLKVDKSEVVPEAEEAGADNHIGNRISDAFEKGLENTILPIKENCIRNAVTTYDEENDDEDEIYDEELKELNEIVKEEETEEDNSEFESKIKNIRHAEPRSITHHENVSGFHISKGLERSEIQTFSVLPEDDHDAIEKEEEQNLPKISVDFRPNGYSKSLKYSQPCAASDTSCSEMCHSRTKNKFLDKDKCDRNGVITHVGVTLPVKTEFPGKSRNCPKNENHCFVECSIECKGDSRSQNVPLDIKIIPDSFKENSDDLLINDVLDSIDAEPHCVSKSETETITLPKTVSCKKTRFKNEVEEMRQSVPEVQTQKVDDLQPIKVSEIRLNGSRFHTGVFINDDKILFPDYVFEKLKIFDVKGTELHRFTLARKPWDVACNTKGEIIVSFPNSMCIKKYKLINNNLIELSTIDMFSFGIDGFDDILGHQYLFVNQKTVNILDPSGKLFRCIPTTTINSKVVASKKDLKFYYTDGNDIVCETKWGKRVCTYSYPINETPIALSLDSTGNLYVCCFNSGQITIYKVSVSGKHFLKAKMNWVEPDPPRNIVFDSKGEHFFITSHVETPPNLNHVERSRELLVLQPQIAEAGLAEVYKLPSKNVVVL